MEKKYIAVTIAMIFVVLFVIGMFFTEQQIDIAGCTAKWSLASVVVPQSDLCPAETCTASPDAQQHNAIVDGLLCACEKARAQGYSDPAVNSRIKEVINAFFDYNVEANEICDQPGIIMTKRSYG